eukprot:2800267-Rhodomonas_salina.1
MATRGSIPSPVRVPLRSGPDRKEDEGNQNRAWRTGSLGSADSSHSRERAAVIPIERVLEVSGEWSTPPRMKGCSRSAAAEGLSVVQVYPLRQKSVCGTSIPTASRGPYTFTPRDGTVYLRVSPVHHRHRDKQTQTQTQTDRDTDTKREGERERERERDTHTHTNRERDLVTGEAGVEESHTVLP